jgi:hypothetical protein
VSNVKVALKFVILCYLHLMTEIRPNIADLREYCDDYLINRVVLTN